MLNAGKRVAMLVGAGALHAADEVIAVADCSARASPRRCSARPSLPDNLPFVTGSIGLLGTKPSWDLMMDCDTLLMVGTSFPYSEFLPEEGQARGVQIDIDGRMLGIRYPMEVNLVGDPPRPCARCMPLLKRKRTASWREKIEGEVARVVEADGGARACSTPTRSIRSASSASCPRACPDSASSPPTRARRPTGSRAT